MISEAYIYDAIRTPRGKGKNGALHGVKPVTCWPTSSTRSWTATRGSTRCWSTTSSSAA